MLPSMVWTVEPSQDSTMPTWSAPPSPPQSKNTMSPGRVSYPRSRHSPADSNHWTPAEQAANFGTAPASM